MRDLTIRLQNRPGALADMGEALGRAGAEGTEGLEFVARGPKGRYEIATSVRAWWGRYRIISKGPKGRHPTR
jgi:hypothetical protein